MFCAREMSESISQGVTANRPGPAGGLLQLNDESYSHTSNTTTNKFEACGIIKGCCHEENILQ